MTYKWEALDSATAETGTAIGNTNSIVVADAQVDKYIKVTVTDAAGTTYSAVTASPVEKNNTAVVTISDENGLQSNGTGLVGDTLHLSYGSGLGVPSIITWYYDDVVTATATGNATTMDAVLRIQTGVYNDGTKDIDTGRKDGKYKVVITNSAGQTYTSNVLELVYDEELGSVEGFGIADDYSDSDNLSYNKDDATAVLSITMNKAYEGTFYIYKDDVQKYTKTNITSKQFVLNNAGTKWVDENGKDWVAMTTFDKMTAKNAYDYTYGAINGGNAGICYTAANGATTLMWVVNNAGTYTYSLRRGNSYKLAFDQKNVGSDDIGTTARTDIVTTDPVLADYITAPAGIVLESAAQGQPAKINFVDAEGAKLEWLGAETTTAMGAAGFDYVQVYGNDSAKDDGKVKDVEGGSFKKGVFTTTNDLSKKKAVYYAVAKTKAGIFGAEATELKSEWKTGNLEIATEVKLVEDATTPTSAYLTFKGVVAPGTVYVYFEGDGAFDETDSSNGYRASAEIDVAQGEVTIPGVFKAEDASQSNGTDHFAAVIVPKDEAAFARFYGKTDDDNDKDDDKNLATFLLKQVPTSVSFDSTDTAQVGAVTEDTKVATIKTLPLIVKDQFGEGLVDGKFDAVKDKKVTVTAKDAGGRFVEAATALWNLSTPTNLTVVVTRTDGVDKKDGFDLGLLGTTFEMRGAVSIAKDGDGTGMYNVKMGSDDLVKTTYTPEAAMNADDELALVDALSNGTTKTVTLTSAGAITLTKDLTVAADQKIVMNGKELVVGEGVTLTNNGEINNATSKITNKGTVTNNKTISNPATLDTNKGTWNLNSDDPANNGLVLTKIGTGTITTSAAVNLKSDTSFAAATTIATNETVTVSSGKTFEAGHNLTVAAGGKLIASGATLKAAKAITIKATANANTVMTDAKFAIATDASAGGNEVSFNDGTNTVTVSYSADTADGGGDYSTAKALTDSEAATGAYATITGGETPTLATSI